MAYLLYMNDIVPKDRVMNAEILRAVEMPALQMFYWSDEAPQGNKK